MAGSLSGMVGDYLFNQRIRTDRTGLESLAVRIARDVDNSDVPAIRESLSLAARELGGRIMLLDENGKVLGYAGLLVMMDEGYITNVAVFPEYRRMGVAAKIIEVYMNFAAANDLAFLTLEVRPSNEAAIALYRRFGFEEVGRRKNYYDLPKEDALILTRYFKEDEQ